MKKKNYKRNYKGEANYEVFLTSTIPFRVLVKATTRVQAKSIAESLVEGVIKNSGVEDFYEKFETGTVTQMEKITSKNPYIIIF